jgi:hypothetical protein
MFYVVQKIRSKNVKEPARYPLHMDADERRENPQPVTLPNCTNSNADIYKNRREFM